MLEKLFFVLAIGKVALWRYIAVWFLAVSIFYYYDYIFYLYYAKLMFLKSIIVLCIHKNQGILLVL